MRSDGHGGTVCIDFMLDLPQARLLRHGDGLMLDDGRVIEVRAAQEALYEIRARDAIHLIQLAWQLGNRHLPAQIFPGHILIRRDPVIGDMIEGLGGTVQEIDAPFDPEAGAYRQSVQNNYDHHAHSHSHGHNG